jgi:type II secretion system protein L
MSKLCTLSVLLYNNQSAQADYLIVTDSSQVIVNVVKGALSDWQLQQQLPQLAKIIVFIPSQDVWLNMINLPVLPPRQLRQAVVNALAPQLLAKPSSLHFALGPRQDDGVLPVAVISNNKLQSWLSLLTQHNISPQVLLPSIFAMTYMPQQPQLAMLDTVCHVRSGLYSGFACDLANLSLLLADTADSQLKVKTGLADLHLQPGHITVDMNLLPAKFVNLKLADWHMQPYNRQLWVKNGIVLLLLWLLLLIWPLQAAMSWRWRCWQLKQQLAVIYQRYHCQWWQPAPNILAQQLIKQRVAHDPALFWSLLALIAQQEQLVTISAIVWRHQALVIKLSTATQANLRKFIAVLEAANCIVQMRHSSHDGTVRAVLLVKRR